MVWMEDETFEVSLSNAIPEGVFLYEMILYGRRKDINKNAFIEI